MPLAFAEWEGVVEEVVSGDTLKVNYEGGLYNVRLYGVEAPKLSQPYGVAAKDATSNLVLGRSVDVHRIYADGNTDVAIVYIHDQYSIQAYLTGAGLAWVHSADCREDICVRWQSMETQAREAEQGLWASANPVPPWNWKTAPAVKKKPVIRRKKKVGRRKPVRWKIASTVQSEKTVETAVNPPEVQKTPVPVESSAPEPVKPAS